MSSKIVVSIVTAALLALGGGAPAAVAGFTLASQFNPGLGQVIGEAYDPFNGTVWAYAGFNADIRQYSLAGAFLSSVPRPGEGANDFDLEIAPEALVLNGTLVPAGTLLVINGETGVAEIYAVDKTSGAVLASLTTAFGVSHVVGGAYHPGRDTFFLVQDGVPANAADKSVVAEISPATGAVLGSFKVDSVLPGFTVNFGDIDISTATGNVWVASSDETSLAEFTPAGVFVQLNALPAGVSSLAGLGLDDAGGGAWVSSTNGSVSHIVGSTWSALGNALAGTSGLPSLTGSGTLVAGAPTSLNVANAKPLSTAFLIVGYSALGAPFKGGTLVPSPNLISPALPMNGAGSTGLAFAWPAGLPAAFPLWYQFWIVDSAGVAGFSATNGLKSLTP